MFVKMQIQKVLLFAIGFSIIFYVVKISGVVPLDAIEEDARSVIPLFSGITVIFSIVSGFIIQSQWHKWDTLLDAARGEVNMLRHLYIMAANFPATHRKTLRTSIEKYLEVLLEKSNPSVRHRGVRSVEVDEALAVLDKTVFTIMEKYNQTGMGVFMLFNRAVEFRETRIQNGSHRLPLMLKLLIVLMTSILITASFFIFFNNIWFEYIFRLILALLAYTIYLLVDDLDDPFRPGNWQLTFKGYKELLDDIQKMKKKY
jgi:hypothetical protein